MSLPTAVMTFQHRSHFSPWAEATAPARAPPTVPSASETMSRAARAAAATGGAPIAWCAREQPDRREHLRIPGLGLAFVPSRPGMEYGQKPFRRVRLDAMAEPEGRARLRFQTRMAALLREEGVAALKDAKASHDQLEAVYNPYVDFDGVRTLAALEAGRLLSWLG